MHPRSAIAPIVLAGALLCASAPVLGDEVPPIPEPGHEAPPEPQPPPPPAEPAEDAQSEQATEEAAPDPHRPEDGDWSGSVGAGFLATDGNSQSRSANGKITADYKRKRWKNSFQSSAVNATGTTGTTAERYMVSDKVDYEFFARNYAFVVAEYEKDLFGATRERNSQAAGVGRHVLAGPVHLWDVEIGGGVREIEDNTTRVAQSEGIARASTKYEWKLTDKNVFTQTLKTEAGATNTISESVTQLKVNVIGNLSSTLSYTVRHNAQVPPDRAATDAEAALNLVYDIGVE